MMTAAHRLFRAVLAGVPAFGVLMFAIATALAQPQPAPTPAPTVEALPAPPPDQRGFATAQEAADAFRAALAADDTQGLLAMFGPAHADLVEGPDPASARVDRQRAAHAAKERMRLHEEGDVAGILLGHNDWPFPIPLVRVDRRWFFDTLAGEEEIFARRVGADELDAIAAVHAFIQAEHEYMARQKAAGRPAAYARYIQSSPGSTDGLWWPVQLVEGNAAGNTQASPLAAFVEKQRVFLEGRQPGDPYRGYWFRILTAQGAGAPGGAMSYVVDDRLEKGFAILAWPADYGQSGIMTFLAGPDGRVLQKDLGEDTASVAQTIWAYDPSDGWTPVNAR
ncbi:DUF2950 family protein [Azospirillum soli]|uniref:DUF2950 family protein n=1 Tax=Azospirillum soli TaxID=1304799 RepID=UPI001FE51F00|nr:DUF2950 family protein [Azospirillum soli]MBP2312636.1 hypothetical protein [Azospirillum soli]